MPKSAVGYEGTTLRTRRDFDVDEMRALVDACADWLWETDTAHRFCWLSSGFEENTGVHPYAALGRMRLDDPANTSPNGGAARESLVDLEARRPFRDFVWRPAGAEAPSCRILLSGFPIFDAAGEFTGYRGTGRAVASVLTAAEGPVRDGHAERLMTALNAMEDAFCYYDSNDRIVLYNSALLNIYQGMDDVIRSGAHFADVLDALIERGLWKLEATTPEQFRQKALEGHRNLTQAQSTFQLADGRWIMRRDIRTEDGGTIAISTDISQLKRHEAKLDKARRDAENAQGRLQSAVDALDNAFALWDRDDRLIACNKAFSRLYGFEEGIQAGRGFADIFTEFAHSGIPREAAGREAEWVAERVARRREELDREIEFETHDGRWVIRRDQLTAAGDRVGTRTDITDLKRREHELEEAHRQSEQLRFDLERLLDSLKMGVVLLDSNLNTVIVNKAFYDIWRVSPDDVAVGRPFRALMDVNRHNGVYDVAEADWESYVASRLTEISAGDVAPREFTRADGCTMIYSVTALSGGKRMVSYFDVTDMKTREAQLAAALERSMLGDAVVNGVTDPIFVKDRDLKFVFVNEAFSRLFGCKPEEMIGRKGADFVAPAEAALFEESERMVLDTGEHYEVEEDFESEGLGQSRIVRKDRVRTASGRDYVACSILDVTERKRRETEAEEARKRLAYVLESLPAGIIIYDKDNRFVLANRQIQAALPALADAQKPGRPLREAVEAAHAAGYFRDSGDPELDALYDTDPVTWIDRYCERYDVRQAVFERRNIDGRWFKVFDTRTDDGTFVGVRVDISELKERERALNESMSQIELFSHVLDELPVSTYVKAADLSLEFVNKAWCVMTGVEKEDAIGSTDRDLFGEEGEGFSERDTGVLETGISNETEETLTHRDGTVRHLIAKKSRIVGRDGKVHLIGSSTDVSELKQREGELQEAQRQAVLADRAKSEFLANMSHEIRTPMNGVLGMAELLSKSDLDEKQKRFTEIIVKSGNALLTIINDILDFSKIDAGQLVLDPAPFNLTEAIEDVATLVSTRAKEKDLEMIVRVEPGLPEVFLGDAGRIRQIITNLLGNAIKFTDSGHVLVEVTGKARGTEGDLRVSVTDTGIGIPKEKLKLVFEKFSQVDGSSTRRHEGTGLGLAITSRLVALMGGEIGVESEDGKGSTFWFTIALPIVASQHGKKVMPVDVSGARVLIVDDNAVNRSILMEQTMSWGFDSCAAESGPEGLKVLQTAAGYGLDVDCMILDYQMPEMTGADVARAVRSIAGISDTPIVMLTSVDQSISNASCRELGIDAHLIKPARSSQLLETLVSTIQRRRGRFFEGGGLTQPAVLAEPARPATPVVQRTKARAEQAAHETPIRSPDDLHRVDILVAEDNEVNQLVFHQILADTPFTFEIVGNGRLAVEAYRVRKPRMILMDVSMPEMNGLEATGAIREIEAATNRHVPIVGVTAHALKGDRERCIEAGMDDYLSKPISPNALLQKIQRWAGGKTAAARQVR
jgi:PAS domain S-box-containing protein